MQGWQSVASGTRLWRLTVIVQAVAMLIIGIVQVFWTVRLMSRNAHLVNDPALLQELTERATVLTTVVGGLGLVLSGVLIVVGRRWRGGPAVPAASGKAQGYETMAVISLALQVVVLLVTFTSDDGDPGGLATVAQLITVAMLFTAFSMHGGYLRELGSGVAELAASLSRGLIFLFVGAISTAILVATQSFIVGILGLGLIVGGIIWFVYFIIFMNRAVAAYEQGGKLTADVFD